ncbi:MAG: ATP-binding cassette domain-containing protein, partial [Minisyncoccia bacterium]
LIALVIGAIGGLLISFPISRLSGDFVVLLTLAFSSIVVALLSASSFLGGTNGLIGVPLPELFGWKPMGSLSTLALYAIPAVIIIAVCWRLGESPFGRLLRAIKADELATRSLGKRTSAIKFGTFAVTSAFTAVGGVLLVNYFSVVAPPLFSFNQTVLIFAMIIVGGFGTIAGSLLGSAIVVMSQPVLVSLLSYDPLLAETLQPILFGVIIVIILRFRPSGILRRRLRPRKAQRARDDAAAAVLPLSETTDNLKHLVLNSIDKRFGGVVAVKQLSLELKPGVVTALLGPNGAGKSTVYNLVTGAITPDAGVVTLDGEDVTALLPEAMARLGVVRSFQDVRTFTELSALENVMVADQTNLGERALAAIFRWRAVARREAEVRQRALSWLRFVGVDDVYSPVESLSFAQQKLVAIARVVATDAQTILLDEPLSGIEGAAADHVLDVLEQIRKLGRTLCIVEHNVAAVRRIADHAYFMEEGTVTAEGSVEELLASPRLEEAYFGKH